MKRLHGSVGSWKRAVEGKYPRRWAPIWDRFWAYWEWRGGRLRECALMLWVVEVYAFSWWQDIAPNGRERRHWRVSLRGPGSRSWELWDSGWYRSQLTEGWWGERVGVIRWWCRLGDRREACRACVEEVRRICLAQKAG